MNFSKVQFEHDNHSDLLTGADVPANFYKHLLRALSSRKRNGGSLFLITIKVLPPTRSLKEDSPAAKRQISEYEDLLISTFRLIKQNLRSQDFFTRMAVDGFYILISGERSEEPKLIERFKKVFADKSLYLMVSHRLIGDISATDWLNQVDESYFVSV